MGFFGDIFGGASKADKALAADNKALMDTLKTETTTAFQGEQDALNTVLKGWAPVIEGGPNAYGFSTAEDAQIRSDIITQGQTQLTNTENAALLREQQASGGAEAGPAGGREALNAQIAATAAQSTATALGKEKELGYATGREEFNVAQEGVTKAASIFNPAGMAGATVGAGKAATEAQQMVDTANANSLGAKLMGGVIGAIPGIGGSVAQGLSGGGGAKDVGSSLMGMFV